MQKQIEKAIPMSAKVFERVSEVVTSDIIELYNMYNKQGFIMEKGEDAQCELNICFA